MFPILESCPPLVPQYGPPDPKWGLQFWQGQNFIYFELLLPKLVKKSIKISHFQLVNFLTPLKNCFLNFHKYMPEQLGFETMLNIDPWGMAFHAVGVIGLTFDFLLMVSSHCVQESFRPASLFCPARLVYHLVTGE